MSEAGEAPQPPQAEQDQPQMAEYKKRLDIRFAYTHPDGRPYTEDEKKQAVIDAQNEACQTLTTRYDEAMFDGASTDTQRTEEALSLLERSVTEQGKLYEGVTDITQRREALVGLLYRVSPVAVREQMLTELGVLDAPVVMATIMPTLLTMPGPLSSPIHRAPPPIGTPVDTYNMLDRGRPNFKDKPPTPGSSTSSGNSGTTA